MVKRSKTDAMPTPKGQKSNKTGGTTARFDVFDGDGFDGDVFDGGAVGADVFDDAAMPVAGPDAARHLPPNTGRQRVDKWLWYARFFKTRSLATAQVSAGHVRLNGDKILKPATNVVAGDELVFQQGRQTRIVIVRAPGVRRGPAPEAQTLYQDNTPPAPVLGDENFVPPNPRFDGKGRPTGKDRRMADLSRAARLNNDAT